MCTGHVEAHEGQPFPSLPTWQRNASYINLDSSEQVPASDLRCLSLYLAFNRTTHWVLVSLQADPSRLPTLLIFLPLPTVLELACWFACCLSESQASLPPRLPPQLSTLPSWYGAWDIFKRPFHIQQLGNTKRARLKSRPVDILLHQGDHSLDTNNIKPNHVWGRTLLSSCVQTGLCLGSG